MHIEPGLVTGAKLLLGAVTATASLGVAAGLAWETMRERGLPSLLARTGVATAVAIASFQVLPHPPVGISEVHLILGSTLFLLLGAGPAAVGLALGLLLQGLAFAQADLPQYGMSEVIQTEFGYHLIMATAKKPGQPRKFEDVKGDVLAVYAMRLREAVIAQMKPKAQVELLAPAKN